MILYSYDHCPYCVKARMILGLKGVSFELKTLLNDDEETPIQMIGQKMLPILQKEDGSYLPESMDIVQYVDGLDGQPQVQASRQDPALSEWLVEVRDYHYALAMPRWPHMGLEEFATKNAQAYFTEKKERYLGPFAEALQNSSSFIAKAEKHLKVLEELIECDPYVWGSEITEDDFHVFATLRCLTTTKGLELPEKLNQYMSFMSEKSGVPLHWDKALGEEFHV